jgi:hypothetical protein
VHPGASFDRPSGEPRFDIDLPPSDSAIPDQNLTRELAATDHLIDRTWSQANDTD